MVSAKRPLVFLASPVLALLLLAGRARAQTITEFSLPSGTGHFQMITGPDDRLWFSEIDAAGRAGRRVGRLTVDGAYSEVGSSVRGFRLTRGPDGAVWVVSSDQKLYGAQRVESIAAASACVANSTTLCLNGGRFQVRASYDTDSGSGDGNGVALTTDTGYFWFFSPNNVETVVKVVNGCVVNQNYWAFAGGLTDVGVNLVITDMQSGVSKTYTNPRHTAFAPIQRTGDFGVCP